MVSDVAELTRTLRKSATSASGRSFGARLRAELRSRLHEVKADLNSTGQSIFTDESGNRYLIQREPGTP